uniref:Apple domain-containing protein n=1 Tax=Globodera pallida TaxID=36090 RepID=A0A183CDW0_GLOPA
MLLNFSDFSEKSCTGEYAFTFLSDRYMLSSEVSRTKFTQSLEDCLAECLNGGGGTMLCRSVSFNRTDGGCHLSEQNQLSKPSAIRVNNNPNFRIDYYENNCYNNSFTFTSTCEPGGIRVRVDSRIPYTGALYGLYDFFSCRIEPKESKQFEYLFPYPQNSKNCSDSMRIAGQDVLLEVVLSTDGVEPLYFITADDLTYQAKSLQQQLIVLGGDTLIRRRLVVVNSEEELRYYVKTGEVPRPAGA